MCRDHLILKAKFDRPSNGKAGMLGKYCQAGDRIKKRFKRGRYTRKGEDSTTNQRSGVQERKGANAQRRIHLKEMIEKKSERCGLKNS